MTLVMAILMVGVGILGRDSNWDVKQESAGCVDNRRGYLGVRVPTRPLGGVLYENTCNRRSRVCR